MLFQHFSSRAGEVVVVILPILDVILQTLKCQTLFDEYESQLYGKEATRTSISL